MFPGEHRHSIVAVDRPSTLSTVGPWSRAVPRETTPTQLGTGVCRPGSSPGQASHPSALVRGPLQGDRTAAGWGGRSECGRPPCSPGNIYAQSRPSARPTDEPCAEATRPPGTLRSHPTRSARQSGHSLERPVVPRPRLLADATHPSSPGRPPRGAHRGGRSGRLPVLHKDLSLVPAWPGRSGACGPMFEPPSRKPS